MITKLNGNLASTMIRGHIKAVSTYDDAEQDIGEYKPTLVFKLPKSSLKLIYADIRGMRRSLKHSDEDEYSWFYLR
ncbi:hypothetical protein HNP86_001901 [Methanococcus maripaludis]|uniref:Uncharacterized protein n=1 Tax=Methanococcus maripaludis TaxID=39152 RepID=A0A7J9NVN3_METMI|nr:hypothetical protein [Methanococcus maripaludis]MBA2851742.1 hypothetical protein [Methanococcus maripaludis]